MHGLAGMTERGINYWESKDGSDRRLIFWLGDYMQELDAKTGKPILSVRQGRTVWTCATSLARDPNTIRVQSGTPGKVFENLIIARLLHRAKRISPRPATCAPTTCSPASSPGSSTPSPTPANTATTPGPRTPDNISAAPTPGARSRSIPPAASPTSPSAPPTFDYYGADRVGNDVFGNCLIALDARTGKRLWHFQNVHHDMWDYDDVAAPMLITINHNGKKVDAVAMAGKTGYLYVFDRVTGQPIWPIEERKAPTKTNVPGEVLSPTQPIPTVPPPFGRLSFTAKDVNPYMLTDAQRARLHGAPRQRRATWDSSRPSTSPKSSTCPATTAAPTGARPPPTLPTARSMSSPITLPRSCAC